MVFLDLEYYLKKFKRTQDSLTEESSTLNSVFSQCKTRLPANKFIDAVKKVQKQLKTMRQLNFSVPSENVSSSGSYQEPSEWEEVLQSCILWGRVAISTSNACLLAFAHCEQNIKLGHFLMFYVSILAVLARLHTLSKAMSLMVGQLAYAVKVEVEKMSSMGSMTSEHAEKLKWTLLEEMGFPNNYDSVLQHDAPEDACCPVINNDDLGEPISRLSLRNQENNVNDKHQAPFVATLKAANSVRNLRLVCKAEGANMDEKTKSEVEHVLKETDSMCKALLEAKRLVIQQSAEILMSLMTSPASSLRETESTFWTVIEEKGERLTHRKDENLSDHMTELLKSLPCKTKIQKLCQSTLPKICTKEKRHLVKVFKKAKPKLWALKRSGNLDDYKRHVSILVKKVKEVVGRDKTTPRQVSDYIQCCDNSGGTPLLDETEEDVEDVVHLSENGNKAGLEKVLKSCKTVDGLLSTWNDILTNRREDLTLLLPSNVKKSKLMCVKKNILKLKSLPRKQKLKTTIKKITNYLYK